MLIIKSNKTGSVEFDLMIHTWQRTRYDPVMERHVQTVESFKFVGDNFRGLLLICGDEIKELFFQYYEEVKYGRGDQQQYLIKG